uniref:Cadherin domain-containing protein n=1 Tax=Stegastes partitus TaxID=144197 RepID=A0A3B4Z3G1_9TELE
LGAMDFGKHPSRTLRWRLCCTQTTQNILLLLFLTHIAAGQIRYSIPEEMKKGSLIGNVAVDLGIDLQRLRSGRARIVSGENIQYTELKADKGTLVVNQRIDREQLCGEVTPCSFSFDLILENPMELHHITVEVLDINDNSPSFHQHDMKLTIGESAAPGARFVLPTANDPDVGVNGLQDYNLSPNENFILKNDAVGQSNIFYNTLQHSPLPYHRGLREERRLCALYGRTFNDNRYLHSDLCSNLKRRNPLSLLVHWLYFSG